MSTVDIKNNSESLVFPKIKNNFLVFSNYHNDVHWVPTYTNNYLIYNQSDTQILPTEIDVEKIVASKHMGHNIRDYCTFIIDYYENLPTVTIFATGNVFPRHMSEGYFASVVNNEYFTPLEEPGRQKRHVLPLIPVGGHSEYNDSWYLKRPVKKYFYDFDDFLHFCFINVKVPEYVQFAPGANYIVPKKNILRYPKVFYENLRFFVSHTYGIVPGESYIIERALYMIWRGDFEANKNMLQLIGDDFEGVKRTRKPFNIQKFFKGFLYKGIAFYYNFFSK